MDWWPSDQGSPRDELAGSPVAPTSAKTHPLHIITRAPSRHHSSSSLFSPHPPHSVFCLHPDFIVNFTRSETSIRYLPASNNLILSTTSLPSVGSFRPNKSVKMKFSAVAVLAAATGALAWPSNVTYTTEVVTAYTTYCPAPTTISHNGETYTITEVCDGSGAD